ASLFPSILEKSTLRSTEYFTLRFMKKMAQPSRFSVVVSKKVAKTAVGRNKYKRKINTALRELVDKKSPKMAVYGLIFAKKGIDTLSYPQIKEQMAELW